MSKDEIFEIIVSQMLNVMVYQQHIFNSIQNLFNKKIFM